MSSLAERKRHPSSSCRLISILPKSQTFPLVLRDTHALVHCCCLRLTNAIASHYRSSCSEPVFNGISLSASDGSLMLFYTLVLYGALVMAWQRVCKLQPRAVLWPVAVALWGKHVRVVEACDVEACDGQIGDVWRLIVLNAKLRSTSPAEETPSFRRGSILLRTLLRPGHLVGLEGHTGDCRRPARTLTHSAMAEAAAYLVLFVLWAASDAESHLATQAASTAPKRDHRC